MPIGNCDSFKLETCLNYFTRLGTVSNHSLPHDSVFRVTDTRERARGTGEFRLSAEPFDPVSEEPGNQPDPAFPQSPGIILETNSLNFSISLPASFVQ